MKITNYILIVTTIVTSSAVAQAAFLAGWKFESITINQDLSSGLNADTVNGAAGAQIFSSDFVGTGSQGVGSTTLATAANDNAVYSNFTAANVADNTTGTKSIKAQGGGSFIIRFDATNATNLNIGFMAGQNSPLGFGKTNSRNSDLNTVKIEVSTDGASYTQVDAFTYIPNNSTSFAAVDLDGVGGSLEGVDDGLAITALDGVADAFVKISTLNSNDSTTNAIFDNVWVGGTGSISVVPEPSTYALLAGVAGLALAIARRRK